MSARRRRAAGGALFALLVATAAGCGQEGKTVQTTLPVQGLAYDATSVTDTVITDTTGTRFSAVVDLKLKIQTTYANGCEARGGLELRVEGPTETPLFVIQPVARYTADEACNIGLSGDTLQTLTIRTVSLARPRTSATDSVARFEVRGFGTPPIRFEVDMDIASRGDTTTRYEVRVEDKDTGAPLDGAVVRVERYGTPDVLGEGTTSGGTFAFDVACAGSEGTPTDSYVVKVSYSSRITILTVFGHPALCKRREQVIVRV